MGIPRVRLGMRTGKGKKISAENPAFRRGAHSFLTELRGMQPGELKDANTASLGELLLLEGMQLPTAERIIALRAEQPFKDLPHLQEMVGREAGMKIKKKTLQQLTVAPRRGLEVTQALFDFLDQSHLPRELVRMALLPSKIADLPRFVGACAPEHAHLPPPRSDLRRGGDGGPIFKCMGCGASHAAQRLKRAFAHRLRDVPGCVYTQAWLPIVEAALRTDSASVAYTCPSCTLEQTIDNLAVRQVHLIRQADMLGWAVQQATCMATLDQRFLSPPLGLAVGPSGPLEPLGRATFSVTLIRGQSVELVSGTTQFTDHLLGSEWDVSRLSVGAASHISRGLREYGAVQAMRAAGNATVEWGLVLVVDETGWATAQHFIQHGDFECSGLLGGVLAQELQQLEAEKASASREYQGLADQIRDLELKAEECPGVTHAGRVHKEALLNSLLDLWSERAQHPAYIYPNGNELPRLLQVVLRHSALLYSLHIDALKPLWGDGTTFDGDNVKWAAHIAGVEQQVVNLNRMKPADDGPPSPPSSPPMDAPTSHHSSIFKTLWFFLISLVTRAFGGQSAGEYLRPSARPAAYRPPAGASQAVRREYLARWRRDGALRDGETRRARRLARRQGPAMQGSQGSQGSIDNVMGLEGPVGLTSASGRFGEFNSIHRLLAHSDMRRRFAFTATNKDPIATGSTFCWWTGAALPSKEKPLHHIRLQYVDHDGSFTAHSFSTVGRAQNFPSTHAKSACFDEVYSAFVYTQAHDRLYAMLLADSLQLCRNAPISNFCRGLAKPSKCAWSSGIKKLRWEALYFDDIHEFCSSFFPAAYILSCNVGMHVDSRDVSPEYILERSSLQFTRLDVNARNALSNGCISDLHGRVITPEFHIKWVLQRDRDVVHMAWNQVTHFSPHLTLGEQIEGDAGRGIVKFVGS